MSTFRIPNDIKKILEIAKSTKEELIFQQNPQYKKIKAKYKVVQNNDHLDILRHFHETFLKLKFYEECVFWGSKFFEQLKVSEKGTRTDILGNIKLFTAQEDWSSCPQHCRCTWSGGKRTAECQV